MLLEALNVCMFVHACVCVCACSHVCKYIYKYTDLFVIQSVHYSALNMIVLLLLLKTSRFFVHDIQLRLLDLA